MKKAQLFVKILVVVLFMVSCNSEENQNSKEKIATTKLATKEIVKPTEDIVFAIDVSTSMLAQDFVPNRLVAVKKMLKKMILEKEPHQQMSLVLFSGEAFILCPLTKDPILLMKKLNLVDVLKLESGTAIGWGIMLGLYELSKSKSPFKNIVVLTDGVNNSDEYSIDLAAQIANQSNIKIHSFGVGCNGEAVAPVAQKPDKTFIFDKVEVKIDEEILKSIGKKTQGSYLRVTCSADLESLESLNSLISNSESIISTKSDTISEIVLDSIWAKIRFKNEMVTRKFNAAKAVEKK